MLENDKRVNIKTHFTRSVTNHFLKNYSFDNASKEWNKNKNKNKHRYYTYKN